MSRRRKRARKHIPIKELLASALADRLPQEQRDYLREHHLPARQIIAMFTPDHNHLHALGGVDKWWNITMRRRGPELKAKDNRDTSIVAKVDRLGKAHRGFKARRRIVSRVEIVPLRTEGFKADEPLRAEYLREVFDAGPPFDSKKWAAAAARNFEAPNDFVRRLLKPTRRRRRRRGAWTKGRKLQSRSSFERRP